MKFTEKELEEQLLISITALNKISNGYQVEYFKHKNGHYDGKITETTEIAKQALMLINNYKKWIQKLFLLY